MRFTQLVLLAATVVIVSGCATRGYVEDRLEWLRGSLEARMHDQESRMDELSETSRQALEPATGAGVLAEGRFLYDVVLTDDNITFETNSATLTANAEQGLARFADRLREDNRNVYLEIQGHTDATGPVEYSQRLGL